MNKYDVAFEIALKCRGLALHLAGCKKCRNALRRHAPKRMCGYGHSDVDEILYYISQYDDDWPLVEHTLSRMR